MKSECPLVSVVVCAFNAGIYLRPAIESLLLQTYQNFEILLIDDGSSDGSVEQIRDIADPRIRWFCQENMGKPSCLNFALDNCLGDFYAIQDADDLSYPERLEHQVKCFVANPDLAAVFCGYDLIINGKRVAPIEAAKDREQCKLDVQNFKMPSHDPTAMYRIALVRDERYKPHYRIAEGLDYILRIGERHPMVVLGRCLYSYRIHQASITRRNVIARLELVTEALREACSRRRTKFEDKFPNLVRGPTKVRFKESDNNLAGHFIESAKSLLLSNQRAAAVRVGIQCLIRKPFNLQYQKAIVYALLPIMCIRDRKHTKADE